MATKAKKSSEEVVTKKKSATKKGSEKGGKSNGSVALYFGRFRASGGSGKIVELFYANNGKAVKDKDLEKAAGGAALAGRLSPIAAHGKKTGYYTVKASTKVPDAHVMIVKNHKAYQKA